MNNLFSMLYLEDDYSDACAFAKMILDIFREYGETDSIPLASAEDVRNYLCRKGIDWINHNKQFQQCMDQPSRLQKYSLFLIDMKMKGEGGVRGWEIIENIREKRGDQASPIWILSNYSFFAQPAKKDYHIQHFFSKSAAGYGQLKDELIEMFLPVKPIAQKQCLEFTNSSGQNVQIPVSQIVSIEIANRHHYLYQLDQKGIVAHKRAFPSYKIFEIAQRQIQEKGISDLVQISYGVMINVKLVERIEGSGKRYYVWLSQRGDNKPLSVSYPYLKKLKEIYGDSLSLFQ